MLEELWIMLSSYECPLMDKEQKRLLEEVIEVEEKIRLALGSPLSSDFEKLQDLLSKISYISERDAFARGVCWATKYLLAIFKNDI